MPPLSWVSDIEILLVGTTSARKLEKAGCTDFDRSEECIVEEFTDIGKIIAFYCSPGNVDIVDLSSFCNEGLLGSIAIPFLDHRADRCISCFLPCHYTPTEQSGNLRDVHLCLVSAVKGSSEKECAFFNFQFSFHSKRSGSSFSCVSLKYSALIGTVKFDEEVAGELPLLGARLINEYPVTLALNDAGKLKLCVFQWSAVHSKDRFLLGDTMDVLESVPRLPPPRIIPVEMPVQAVFGSGYSTAVGYLKRLIPFRFRGRVNGVRLGEWFHLRISLCAQTVAAKRQTGTIGLLSYSVKTDLDHATLGISETPCQHCGGHQRVSSVSEMAHITPVLALSTISTLRANHRVNATPLRVLVELQPRNATPGADACEAADSDVVSWSQSSSGNEGDSMQCTDCMTSQWLDEGTSHTLLETSTSGRFICLYHIQRFLLPPIQSESQPANAKGSRFSTVGEFRLYSCQSDFLSAPSRASPMVLGGELQEIRRFVLPNVPQHLHPVDMKLSDDALWVLYPQDENGYEGGLFRVSLAQNALFEGSSTASGTIVSASLKKSIMLHGGDSSGAFENHRTGSESSCTITQNDVLEEAMCERFSSTAQERMVHLFQQCSPYMFEDTAENKRSQLFCSLQSTEVTEVFQLADRQSYCQHQSNVCGSMETLLGALRVVMDELEVQPYDETEMSSITKSFLAAVTRLFVLRTRFLIVSGLVTLSDLYRVLYWALDERGEDRLSDTETVPLTELVEIILAKHVNAAVVQIGVLGPQAVAFGASTALSALQMFCRRVYSAKRQRLWLSAVYQTVVVDGFHCTTAELRASERRVFFRHSYCGTLRPLILAANRRVSAVVPLASVMEVWNASLTLWLSRGNLSPTTFAETGVLQKIDAVGAREWLLFLAAKLHDYMQLMRGSKQPTVYFERHLVSEVLKVLYEEISSKKSRHSKTEEPITKATPSCQRLWSLTEEYEELDFSCFSCNAVSPPSHSFIVDLDPNLVYKVLSHAAALGGTRESFPLTLLRFRSFLDSMWALPVEWKNSEQDYLEFVDSLLLEAGRDKDAQPHREAINGLRDEHLHTRNSPFRKLQQAALYSQISHVSLSAFMLFSLTQWATKRLSSTLRRFETVGETRETVNDVNEETDIYQLLWWDVRLGAGSSGTSLVEGLTLSLDGQLNENDLKTLVDLKLDFQARAIQAKALKDFLLQTSAIGHSETLHSICVDEFSSLLCAAEGAKQDNLWQRHTIPSSTFVTARVIYHYAFRSRSWKAAEELCTTWLQSCPSFSVAAGGASGGVLYYLKGLFKALTLHEEESEYSKDLTACDDWAAVSESLDSALLYDSWMLVYNKHYSDEKVLNRMLVQLSGKSAGSRTVSLATVCAVLDALSEEKLTQKQNVLTASDDVQKATETTSVLRGSTLYCLHASWLCAATNAPNELHLYFLKRAAEQLKRLQDEVETNNVVAFDKAQTALWTLVFSSYCRHFALDNNQKASQLEKAITLLTSCPFFAATASELLLDLLETVLCALEAGQQTLEDAVALFGLCRDPVLLGVLLTYLARLTLLLPPASIRARFVMQVFQNLLFERVKNTYEASLHCVILAALLQLRILGLCSTERGHANRAFVLESEETGGFPPNLLCGLELLQQTFQTYRVSGDANNIWEPLLRLVPKTRGIGSDAIELLNIQKNYIRSAITHLEADPDANLVGSLIIPASYFGLTILSPMTSDTATSASSCHYITRSTLISIDRLVVLKLELLSILQRRFTDELEVLDYYQEIVLRASAPHITQLLASAGLLHKAAWCIRTWASVPCEDIFSVFLKSFISDRGLKAPAVKQPLASSSLSRPKVLASETVPSTAAVELRKRRRPSVASDFLSLKANDALSDSTGRSDNRNEIDPTKCVSGERRSLSSLVFLPFALCNTATEELWNQFICVADALYRDRHHISKGFRLEKVFATLLRYKIQDNINIPTEVMDWMLSHPSHSTSQILFINTILELGPPSRTDQIIQKFLEKQRKFQDSALLDEVPIADLVAIDELLPASTRETFREFVRCKLQARNT